MVTRSLISISRIARILILALPVLILAAGAGQAEKVAWRGIDDEWRVTDTADWPKPPKDAKVFGPVGTGIQFTVLYEDVAQDTGTGFDDPVLGQARRDIVDAVLVYMDGLLNETGRCDIEWRLSETDGLGALASAGSFYPLRNGFEEPFSLRHITTGTDPSGAVPDIQGTVDFGKNFNTSLDPPAPNQVDLFTVLLHELTHGLGFASLTDAGGNSAVSGSSPGTFTNYDNLVYTGSGKKLWTSGGVFAGEAGDLTGGDGGVFFRGTSATGVLGVFPLLYSPSNFAQGSSIAHWDQAEFGGQSIMPPAIITGTVLRQYADFELGALKDLGYENVIVPEGGDVFNNERSDINQDGVVDSLDTIILQSDWHKTRN